MEDGRGSKFSMDRVTNLARLQRAGCPEQLHLAWPPERGCKRLTAHLRKYLLFTAASLALLLWLATLEASSSTVTFWCVRTLSRGE
jgi:hypothetical protein